MVVGGGGPIAQNPTGDPDVRVDVWPSPPGNYDPLNPSQSLSDFGLPELPNRAQLPDLHDFLLEMYSPPLQWFQAALGPPAGTQILRRPLHRWAAPATLYETSRNWAGLYITPRDGLMFTAVFGIWRLPIIALPAALPAGLVADDYHMSTWIGFDGQREYFHSSLPQIGVEQYFELVAGFVHERTRAFWQWWARGQLNSSMPFGLPVFPTNEVACLMIVQANNAVRFIMKNLTLGPFFPVFDVIRLAPDGGAVPLRVSGATAEWMTERSTNPNPPFELQQLPEFDSVNYRLCAAVSGTGPANFVRGDSLIGARRITMQAFNANQTGTFPFAGPNSIIAPNQQRPHNFEVVPLP